MPPRLRLTQRWPPTISPTTPCWRSPRPVLLRVTRHNRITVSRCLYSTTQSTTSIEAQHLRAPLPPQHPIEKLQLTLQALQSAGYGEASRIELALRALKQEGAPVRLAIVGADILPLLFAAPVELQELIAAHDKHGRGILLRFGTAPKITTPVGSPLAIVTAPIDVLKTNNVELVVTSNLLGADPLVPLFQSTDIPGARVIEYPVHKTLLYAGSGVAGMGRLLASARFTRDSPEQVRRVIALPGGEGVEGKVQVIDPTKGEEAVKGIREWLLEGTTSPTETAIKPAVKALLHDIFAKAQKDLEEEAKELSVAALESGDTAESLAHAIGGWSQAAHVELRDSMEAAFLGKEWGKIEWWKLLWRTDDVGAVSRNIITTGFLPESEEKATFLAGRLYGAGYSKNETVRTDTGDVMELAENPRPMSITHRRAEILQNLVPNLQAAAQKYLLSFLSTTGISGAFSTLLWLSDVPLYSALTVAAAGSVSSARWLQSRWMKECKTFQGVVREQAREAIVESERWAWERLRAGIQQTEAEAEAERGKEKRGMLQRALKEGAEACKTER
ncbi:hypothetical protein FN846DRAFT_903564 [Sphaerosporella brunnea]|uniref:Mmc1 C-terminal domain-containing protein n=1 Tax=Sphaerosporella brunnea TaxID=1250544 RepID=A0A5J5F6N9_9PEZI|nr:hypothetical protein FN846DRAFT_903564 [Sphaerosporella brunnea]